MPSFQSVDQGFIGYPTASGMIPYWLNVAQPPSASKEERAIAQAVNRLHPFIISRKAEKLEWENTELLVVKSDQDLGVPGGIRTAQTFVRLDLIDEYVLLVHPVAIGKGQGVFTSRVNLELISVKTYESRVTRICYRPRSRS